MHDFSLRREWPCVVALTALGFATRVAVALHPDAYCCGDTAIFALMAKHIWTGQAAPLFCYGQGYNGGQVTWLMAPFYGALGADFRGVLMAHAVVWVLSVPVLYRLVFAVGGRWGAVAALAALGLGTRPLYDAGAMVGYFELLPLAALLFLLVARAARGGAGDGVGLGIGLVVGLGVWTNPQFVAPAFAAFAALWAASPTRALLRRGALAARVGSGPAALVAVALALPVLACAVAFAAVLAGSTAVTRPERVLMRAAAVLVTVWFALELATNPRRRAIACGVVGLVVFAIPHVAYRLGGYADRVHSVPLRLESGHLGRNAADALGLGCEVLFGETGFAQPGPPGLPPSDLGAATWPWALGAAALFALAAVPAVRAAWALMRAAGSAFALAPARVTLGGLLALHAVAAVAPTLLHAERLQERYFDQLWLPYASALAAAVGALAGRDRRWGILALALVFAHHGRDFAGVWTECRGADLRPPYTELEAELVAHGATVGYAHYDEAYLASYLSDERVRLSSYAGWLPRVAAYRDLAARTPRPVAVFAKTEFDRANKDALLARHPDLVVQAWESSRWWFVQVRRPRGGYLEELEGERRGDE